MQAFRLGLTAAFCALLVGAQAGVVAQEKQAPQATAVQERKVGRVTMRPIPRFVAIKKSEGRARRGPSFDHRIDWIYKRSGMPVQIVAEHGNWRKVRDFEGKGGWMHFTLLTGRRYVLVLADRLALREKPGEGERTSAFLEAHTVGRVLSCSVAWCRIRVRDPDGTEYRGWVTKTGVWGVGASEVID